MNRKKKTFADIMNGIVFLIGLILSPLTWWNDLFVNVPLAYLFAQAIARVYQGLFVYAFVFGYWLTNVLGFLLMHHSASQYVKTQDTRRPILKFVFTSLGYTLLIILLAHLKFIASPVSYLRQLRGK